MESEAAWPLVPVGGNSSVAGWPLVPVGGNFLHGAEPD